MAADGLIHRSAVALRTLRAEMAVRETLPERRRRVLDGTVHALKPDSMDADYAARTLIDYDSATPHVVIAVGELHAPTQVTWQIAGMAMGPAQAAWGAAREAAQLHREQGHLGAVRPLVLSWQGYRPPSPLGVLSSRIAARAGERLAEHVWTTSLLWQCTGAGRGAGTALDPWRSLEAHSYGVPVAVRALGLLALWSRTRLERTVPSAGRIDALVLSGSVGAPHHWWGTVSALAERSERGLHRGPRVTEIRARRDLLAPLGRVLSGRRRVPVDTAQGGQIVQAGFPASPESGLIPAVGHNTHGGRGYRDPGTVSLRAIAGATQN